MRYRCLVKNIFAYNIDLLREEILDAGMDHLKAIHAGNSRLIFEFERKLTAEQAAVVSEIVKKHGSDRDGI